MRSLEDYLVVVEEFPDAFLFLKYDPLREKAKYTAHLMLSPTEGGIVASQCFRRDHNVPAEALRLVAEEARRWQLTGAT